jgi:hypothetical protein
VNAKNNTMLLYADDTSVVITESNTANVKHQDFSLLNDINSWLKNNLLSLNVNKTQYLEFRLKNYSIGEQTQKSNSNSSLQSVTHKILGIDH